MKAKDWSWFAILVFIGMISRWVPHLPNFSPMLGLAIFAGFILPMPAALLAPVVASVLGDSLLGFHDLMWVVYLSLLPMVYVGTLMPEPDRRAKSWITWGAAGLAASIFFFITTNLAVWWTSGMYAHTQAGLVTCFLLAIPFFHNSVLATWIFLAGFIAVRRLVPVARPEVI